MPTAFEQQLRYGQEGEHVVAAWLADRGSVVAPLYQFDGHGSAPFCLWDDSGRVVRTTLPDLQCYRGGVAYFSEVKRKRQWWHGGDGPETGVDLRHWRSYLSVRERTGVPLYLFFLQEGSGPTGLFSAEVTDLQSRGPRIWTRGTHLAFFRKAWLTKQASIADLSFHDNRPAA